MSNWNWKGGIKKIHHILPSTSLIAFLPELFLLLNFDITLMNTKDLQLWDFFSQIIIYIKPQRLKLMNFKKYIYINNKTRSQSKHKIKVLQKRITLMSSGVNVCIKGFSISIKKKTIFQCWKRLRITELFCCVLFFFRPHKSQQEAYLKVKLRESDVMWHLYLLFRN